MITKICLDEYIGLVVTVDDEIEVARQLHECEDGTLRLPYNLDSDVSDCHTFVNNEDLSDADEHIPDFSWVLIDSILTDAMEIVGDEDGCIKNEPGILWEAES